MTTTLAESGRTPKRLTDKQVKQEAGYIFPYHYLDLQSDEYRLIWNIEYLAYLRMVKRLAGPFNGQRLLDAGCGDGRFCYELSGENVRLVGVDLSERAIAFAKAFNPGAEFFVQDLEHLDLPHEFDCVVLIETLEHVIPERIPLVLENFSKCLKDGGRLIVTVPSKNMPIFGKHYQHFTEESLAEALKPHFRIKKLAGNSKIGRKSGFFTNMCRLGYAMYPYRKKAGVITRFYGFLNAYYEHNLAVAEPRESRRLIAVCEKA